MIYTFTTRPTTVTAVQWTGENLREVQDFLAPSSPSYDESLLMIRVLSPEAMATYPSLGRQFKSEVVAKLCWIVKDAVGGLSVYSDSEMTRQYQTATDAEIDWANVAANTNVIVPTHLRAISALAGAGAPATEGTVPTSTMHEGEAFRREPEDGERESKR